MPTILSIFKEENNHSLGAGVNLQNLAKGLKALCSMVRPPAPKESEQLCLE